MSDLADKQAVEQVFAFLKEKDLYTDGHLDEWVKWRQFAQILNEAASISEKIRGSDEFNGGSVAVIASALFGLKHDLDAREVAFDCLGAAELIFFAQWASHNARKKLNRYFGYRDEW